ncbi:MAG: synthase [Candidatus Atribacteria bacterium]|nr:synthase [Candidatus Atribacteria bacterium]
MKDWKEEKEKIVRWIQNRVKAANAQGLVLGMSGGIDSSVLAVLAKSALPNHTLGLMLPCHSLKEDLEDALLVAQQFSIPYQIIPLNEVFDLFYQTIMKEQTIPPNQMAQANLKSRLRMCTLYYFANSMNYLVGGSSNRSELLVGYFTKHGDSGVDLLPIAHLTKTEVREMALFLGIPEKIITKPPSAGLWPGQTDEEEMGVSYSQIDRFIETGEVEEPYRSLIQNLIAKNQHKRQLPPTPEEG